MLVSPYSKLPRKICENFCIIVIFLYGSDGVLRQFFEPCHGRFQAVYGRIRCFAVGIVHACLLAKFVFVSDDIQDIVSYLESEAEVLGISRKIV